MQLNSTKTNFPEIFTTQKLITEKREKTKSERFTNKFVLLNHVTLINSKPCKCRKKKKCGTCRTAVRTIQKHDKSENLSTMQIKLNYIFTLIVMLVSPGHSGGIGHSKGLTPTSKQTSKNLIIFF